MHLALAAAHPRAPLTEAHLSAAAHESAWEGIARVAAQVCGASIGSVSFIGERPPRPTESGTKRPERTRMNLFARHAVRGTDLLEVPDAALDVRFRACALVSRGVGIRFYCGMPLVGRDGFVLGTLDVMDRSPRALAEWQRAALRQLARAVVGLLEARHAGGFDADESADDERRTTALEAALEGIRTLSAAISRDLRVPLRAITTDVSSLLERWRAAIPREARRLVFGIGTRALELDRLFQGLAGLAALAQVPTRFEKVPLARIAREAWAKLEPECQGRGVTFEVGALPVVEGDRILLARALRALLENAVKFTREIPVPRIAVRLREDAARVRLLRARQRCRFRSRVCRAALRAIRAAAQP